MFPLHIYDLKVNDILAFMWLIRVIQFKTGARQCFKIISQGNEMGQFYSLQFNRKACTYTHTHTKSMHMQTQLVCNYDLLYLSFFCTFPKPRTSLPLSEMKLRFHILVGSKAETCILLLALPVCTGPIEITMTPEVNSTIRPWGDPFGLSFLWIFFCITGTRTQLSLLLSMPCAKSQIH